MTHTTRYITTERTPLTYTTMAATATAERLDAGADTRALPPWAAFLFAPRQRKDHRLEPGDIVVLILYAVISAFAIHNHRNWADEAQAWLIARDSSLHDLLFRRLHYEGAPALWPLILWTAARLHLPYAGINWIGGVFAFAAVVLLLRISPFPRIFRWLLPFTFFLQYQYATLARPYVLFPLLLFALAALFASIKPRPFAFAAVAGLLVNISLHAAILSGLFSLLYLRELLRPGRPSQVTPRRLLAAAAVFIVFCIAAISVAFPATDVYMDHSTSHLHIAQSLRERFVPEEHLPPGAPPLDPPFEATDASGPGTAKPAPLSPITQRLLKTFILAANTACFPIARSNLLAVAFLATLLLWLESRHRLLLALPFALGIVIAVQVWVDEHHTGQFLLALVAAVWIALESPRPNIQSTRKSNWRAPAFAIAALVVTLLQIGWTFHCIRGEARTPYDPGRATEAFLAANFPNKRIAGFNYFTVSTQAYAPRNLFFNQPDAFWHFSAHTWVDSRRGEALAQHPDAVVVTDLTTRGEFSYNQWLAIAPNGVHPFAPMLRFWQQNGYHATRRFCGDRVMRLGTTITLCEVVLERDTEIPAK